MGEKSKSKGKSKVVKEEAIATAIEGNDSDWTPGYSEKAETKPEAVEVHETKADAIADKIKLDGKKLRRKKKPEEEELEEFRKDEETGDDDVDDDDEEESIKKKLEKKKANLITILTRYGSSQAFGEHLKAVGFHLAADTIRNKTYKELIKLHKDVKRACNNKEVQSFHGMFYKVGIQIVEGSSQIPTIKSKFDLSGLSEMVENDKSIQNILEVMAIENGNIEDLSPTQQLMMATAFAMVRTAGKNKLEQYTRLKLSSSQNTPVIETQPAQPTAATVLTADVERESNVKTEKNNEVYEIKLL